MTLFRLDASIRTDGSVSRAVADTVERAWSARQPGQEVIGRDLGQSPLPAGAWSAAVGGSRVPAERRTSAQRDAATLAGALADELIAADGYLFAVPMYNFGVPQHVKTWVDLVITDPRFAPGGEPVLAGRPAVLVTVRGGGYGPGTPRHGWDHATPWLRQILADVFGLDLHLVEAELTLAGVVPAMAELRDLADQVLRRAHASAEEYGNLLAERTPVRAVAY